MKIDIVTIFPELFDTFLNIGIIGRSIKDGKLEIVPHDLRKYTPYKHNQIDDYPYGGGRGMIFMIEPLYNAYKALKKEHTFTVLMSAGGTLLTATRAKRLSKMEHILIFCGRYEGLDERFLNFVDMEISIGKFVLFGGEVAAQVLIEAATRFIPEILDKEVTENETYSLGKFRDHPQYTRPEDFKGMKTPKTLLSGNHKEIEKWRKENQKKI
ncbi:tRNA (guanosine(37)-N1)-methyltransferase TrmD [bacterium]|nr:tRNA (guanosine(37)-N1)-methyltransferase TrmD [bacterium]